MNFFYLFLWFVFFLHLHLDVAKGSPWPFSPSSEAQGKTIFLDNMSAVGTGPSIFEAIQFQGGGDTEIAGSLGEVNEDNLDYKIKDKTQGLGVWMPLGGAAFGLDRTFSAKDVITKSARTSGNTKETYRDTYYRAHFSVDLTPEINACFSYRYLILQNDIKGSIFLANDDATAYKGFLAGYAASFYISKSTYQIGGFYLPAMRGKSEIAGEDKILTVPGYAGINIYYPMFKEMGIALKSLRWFYKRDDRGELSTSPIDQRAISLNGLDFDQFLFLTERYSLGFNFDISDKLRFLGDLHKNLGVFIFNGDKVPGDEVVGETDISFSAVNASIIYLAKSATLRIGIYSGSKSKSNIRDSSRRQTWFGHRDYSGYNSSDSYLYFGFGVNY